MRCIEAMGMNYGLRLNWKKCEVLPIGCEASIAAPDGSYLACKSSISYLGSYLDATGAGGPAICRRLGEAKGKFDKLASVWRHSTLHPQQKIRIFQACVVSKLLYCLHTMWLNKAELRKIDGFQAKCLRSILHIPPPYIIRISNATVLQRSHCKRMSNILYSNPLQCYLMMMFADDAFSNLVVLFWKTCQLHAGGVAPNKYGPLAFPAHVSPYTRRMIYKQDLHRFDVLQRRLLRSVVGPPRNVDWTQPWHEILHQWNGRIQSFMGQLKCKPWSEMCLQHHWNLAHYFALLPDHRWLKRVLHWNPCGRRRVGRPKNSWTASLEFFVA